MTDVEAHMRGYSDALRRNIGARKALGSDARCRNCIFWQPDGWQGECRRHAPAPMQVLIEDIRFLIGKIAWATEKQANVKHDKCADYEGGSMGDFGVNQWPSTNADDWCGEFQAGRKAR